MSSPHRIFSNVSVKAGDELSLEGDRARYISRALRLGPGDRFILFDGSGGEYRVAITRITKNRVDVLPESFERRSVESALAIRLLQGVAKGERMDTVVQKATELGVARISPVLTDYSVIRLDADKASRRAGHWQRIAISACEQSGRNTVPQVDTPRTLAEVLQRPERMPGQRLLLNPDAEMKIGSTVLGNAPITLLIGPEGGLSPIEIERAINAGFVTLSMGPRILRTETAAIAALAILQARIGDM